MVLCNLFSPPFVFSYVHLRNVYSHLAAFRYLHIACLLVCLTCTLVFRIPACVFVVPCFAFLQLTMAYVAVLLSCSLYVSLHETCSLNASEFAFCTPHCCAFVAIVPLFICTCTASFFAHSSAPRLSKIRERFSLCASAACLHLLSGHAS